MPARLSALDASYITLERSGLPMNVGGFVVLGQPADVPPLTLGRLRTRMASRAVELSRLRQRLYEVPLDLARPVWGDDPDFTVEHHVRELTLPPPGGRRDLERLAARLHGEPMELGRPLWDLSLIHGSSDGNAILYFRFHHAFADGLRAIALAAALFDAPGNMPRYDGIPRPAPSRRPGNWDLVADAVTEGNARVLRRNWERMIDVAEPSAGLREVQHLIDGALAFLDSPPPRTPLTGRARQGRRVILRELSAARLRAARRTHKTDPAVVVLAVVSGALARLFGARGQRCPAVRTFVPMGNSRSASSVYGNDAAFVLIDLPTGQLSPADRIRAIAQSMTAARAVQLPATRALLRGWEDATPASDAMVVSLGAALAEDYHIADVLVSYLRWPRPVPPMLGLPYRTTFPVLPLSGNLGLIIGIADVAGSATISIAADPGIVPEAGFLAAAFTDALAELAGDH
jgi:diacylglycerol O-acyltransferase / wax synthase